MGMKREAVQEERQRTTQQQRQDNCNELGAVVVDSSSSRFNNERNQRISNNNTNNNGQQQLITSNSGSGVTSPINSSTILLQRGVSLDSCNSLASSQNNISSNSQFLDLNIERLLEAQKRIQVIRPFNELVRIEFIDCWFIKRELINQLQSNQYNLIFYVLFLL